jgi:hypothetical protein
MSKRTWLSFARYLRRAREMENLPQIERQLEALELSYLLTVMKNDSMNLNFGYMTSYDCCRHHHMNANELWLCMIALVIISE